MSQTSSSGALPRNGQATATDRSLADLRERVERHPSWYHTLELASGLVTPGWYDLRSLPDRIPFPTDLAGRRCLDVATFDGFWAFAMEQRDAAEVQAIDLLDDDGWDWPVDRSEETTRALAERKEAGQGFCIARDALGSSVERRELSVYDLDPDDIGTFDFVYLGSLLLHLKDPVRALEAVRSVCRGSVTILDAIHLPNTICHPRQPNATLDGRGRPWWWKPNRAGLIRLVESAGFSIVGRPRTVLMPPGAGQRRLGWKASLRAMQHPDGRTVAFRTYLGDAHLALAARPT